MERWKTYDDIEIGSSFRSVGRTISETDVLLFTALTCGFHQPLHTDLEWVRANTTFKERLLPGPAIIAYSIGLLSATLIYRDVTVAFAGMDRIRAKAPVIPGDTIHAVGTVKSAKVTSDGVRAVVTLEISVRNQRDEEVMTYDYALMTKVASEVGKESPVVAPNAV